MNIKASKKQYRYLFAIILLPMIVMGFYSYKIEKKRILDASTVYMQYAINTKEDLLKRLFEQHKININNLKRTVKLLRNQQRNYIENIQYTKVEQLNNYIDSVKRNLRLLSFKEEILTLLSRLNKRKNVNRFAIQYLPYLRDEMQIDEIYLINKDGLITASSDSNVSYLYPIYKLTPTLYDTWKNISSMKYNPNNIIFADFSKKSTTQEYAAFGLIAVHGGNYIAVSLSKKMINTIMQFKTDAFKSIESYLIGYFDEKSYLVNDRIVKSKQHLGDIKNSLQIEKAKNGFKGIDTKIGSTGEYEIAAYIPIEYRGLKWSIHTTMSYKEVLTPSIGNKSMMNEFIKNFGYYDLFFVDKFGTVFYTIKKESDYLSNIYRGNLSNSNFSKTIRDTIKTKQLQISQFKPYQPSKNKKAGFISSAVLDEKEDIELIIALQIPFESMTKIMNVGLSKEFTTHSFLIDNDFEVLVDSNDDIELHNNNIEFLNSIKKIIKSNNTDVIITEDDNKNLLMQSNIVIENFNWHLFVQMPYRQIQERIFWIAVRIIVSILIIVLVSLFFLWRFAKINKSHAHELELLAYNDTLTGLANRSFFLEYLKKSLNRSKRNKNKLAILFVDLDHFKYINDSYGHASGDNVLIEVANRLRQSVRNEDFVARIGGDEFIILLNNIENFLDIEIIAQKINSLLAQPIKDNFGHVYHIGCSIGISLYPDDSTIAEKLITYSDTAMYKAKESGRNQHAFYKSEITSKAKEKITLLNDLTQAIEKNEFVIYYQPQIDPKNGKLIAVEALVRWQHPRKGLLFPDSFILMAEESRKIIDLGSIVLKKACEDFLFFGEQGIELEHISVNISSKQLFARNFVSDVIELLESLNFEPKHLELEITETSMVENIEQAVEIIEELNAYGIRFSIDDFGTGFSSLEYLKRLKVNTLKIDRAFIMDLPDNLEDIAIINAVIYMAYEFGFEVVAEGVETKEQLDFLTNLTQKLLIQGYYYFKPIPKDEFISTYKV
jgi:diguanylate cyclase (GGDEF)-like protein